MEHLHQPKLQLILEQHYIGILNEVDRIIRNTESIEPTKIENYKINEIKSNSYLTRTGGNYCYFSDNITRRSISLNTVNKNKNLVYVNKKTLVENNIDLEKNKKRRRRITKEALKYIKKIDVD